MRHLTHAALALTAATLLLAGCAGQRTAAADPLDVAWENCTEAYEQFPLSLDVLAEQNPGTEVSAETPCENWIDSQGREEFTEFWTDPDEFMDHVVLQAKLEAVSSE